ncbi:hypothetical protein Ait01nite_098240 [Actinoplanes italicus]|uniref:Phosphotransferase family enzyme n=1 Tax=Actinoplanes italicus TaxID=113567 RepID=A0A2T0JGA6_9ACTN|nr:hypothetical protein [Actinoplanes italicus]PRX06655.1 hypothetical protein CLV67_14334 [Actinoplanes italicus]GIE36779.1 hypothetical protein Ait01nite_098240 [Actinoplanes italicus]
MATVDSRGPVVSRTETRLRRTIVHEAAPGSYLWWLRPGDADPVARTAMPENMRPAVSEASSVRLRFVLPDPDRDGLTYRVGSPLSAAFWQGAGPVVEDRLSEVLGDVVRGLARLHRIRVWTTPAQPPGIARLRHWLDHPDLRDGGARLHRLARRAWGPAGLRRIAEWAAAAGGRTGTMLHGNLSLSAVVPTLDGTGPVELLTGAELSGGDPAFDLGWLLGELRELAFVAGTDTDPLTAAVLRAADPALLDRPARHQATVLRIVTHMRDHACAMPWTDELADYTDLISALLDAAPRSTQETLR